MKYIGAHLSAARGVENVPLNDCNIDATACALNQISLIPETSENY